MWIEALANISFHKPNLFAIVILPYIQRQVSLRPYIEQLFNLNQLRRKFVTLTVLRRLKKMFLMLMLMLKSNNLSFLCAYFPNQIASDLEEFSLSPLQSSKRRSISSSFPNESSSLQKVVVSSAYCDNFISLLATTMSVLAFIEQDNNSTANTKRRPDNGYPGLTPREPFQGIAIIHFAARNVIVIESFNPYLEVMPKVGDV